MSREPNPSPLRIELYPRVRDLDVSAKRITEDFLRENPGLAATAFRVDTAKAYTVSAEFSESELLPALEEVLVNPVLDQTNENDVWP